MVIKMAVNALTGVPGDVVVDIPGQNTQPLVDILPRKEPVQINLEQQVSPELKKEDIEKLTENLNQLMDSFNVSTRFSVHEVTKDIMVRVYNSKTNETIREIPPRKIVDMVARMMELVGLLTDEKA